MSVVTKLHQDIECKESVELLKRTVGKDLTDLEFELFANICKKIDLDPFIKQIYPLKIGGKMSIITGIDGLRSIAERTGNYSPGKEPSFQYDKEGSLICATAYVKKRTPDGTWHEVSATAFFSEYRPAHGGGSFWKDKPHIMIAKCAEALAIRRAFPSVTANLYTKDEMEQAEPMMEVTLESRETPRVETYVHQTQKMQPRAKETPSQAIPGDEPIQKLKECLEDEGISSERLEEWVSLRCQTKNQERAVVIQTCLDEKVVPIFKASYVKWVNKVSQPV